MLMKKYNLVNLLILWKNKDIMTGKHAGVMFDFFYDYDLYASEIYCAISHATISNSYYTFGLNIVKLIYCLLTYPQPAQYYI